MSDFESSLRREIADLEERRSKLASELTRIDGHLGGLQRALNLYLGEPATFRRTSTGVSKDTRAPDPAKSESWAFVLSLLEDAPDSGFSVDEIAARCAERGYNVARNTLLANLSNGYQDGTIQRVRTGHYKRRTNGSGVLTALEDTAPKESSAGEIQSHLGYSEHSES